VQLQVQRTHNAAGVRHAASKHTAYGERLAWISEQDLQRGRVTDMYTQASHLGAMFSC
jgi:hypothetical protein